MALFYHVIELYNIKGIVLTPQNWLRYQLSCRQERDSFAIIFVFLIMRGTHFQLLRPITDYIDLLWYFDEVQDDLAKITRDFEEDSTTILEGFIQAVRSSKMGPTTAVLSGTSLNMDRVKAIVDKSDNTWREPSANRIVSCFALITEDSIFAKVFQSRTAELLSILYGSSSREDFLRKIYSGNKVFIPANKRAFNEFSLFWKFREYYDRFHTGEPPPREDIIGELQEYTVKIVQSSLSFRGRYHWSVYYVEKLLEQYFMDGAMTEKAINDVAEVAKRTLKAPIERRLRSLARRPEQARILKDVYSMAFNTDLLGRSRILSSEGNVELIKQALGYVEVLEGESVEAVKVSLAERLVVDSVMEYLEETQQLQPLVIEYLYANQFHEGALRDAAEVGLADSVNRWGSQELPQRRELISVFDSVYGISGAGCRFNVNLDLDNFFLEKGEGLRRDYLQALPESYQLAEAEDLGLKQWLYLVCNGKPRPTFLFPEHVAGPDLMFVYRERSGTRRIVFAIQVRTTSLYIWAHESNICK
jgi:hypothetical protein